MILHIVTMANIEKLNHSNLASDRLRLEFICKAAKELGYTLTSGLNIPKADIYFIPALTKEINKILVSKIIEISKRNNIHLFTDYVDDWLSSSNSELKLIYESLIKADAVFTVPIKALENRLKEKINKIFTIPDGLDKIQISQPKILNNGLKNILWHGHASNISSLIRVLTEDLVEYDFNLHLVTNYPSVEILKKTKFKKIPKCKFIFHPWELNKLQRISKRCDFAIIPVNKRWASENRLITTFILGLPIIAETINSYKDFSNYYLDFKQDQIQEMFNNPEKFHNDVLVAQNKILMNYNSDKLISLWKACLNSVK